MLANPGFWTGRFKAFGIHFCISLALAAMAACLVFAVWYPYPYSVISGGRELFFLIVGVDVIVGPLITFCVYSATKARHLMRFDFVVIGLLQLAALSYGLWAMAMARPVHLVFEIYRFNVVAAIDVPKELINRAPPELQRFPLSGPTLLSVRDFKNSQEKSDVNMDALGGIAVGARPDLWQSYEKARPQILASGRPLADLKTRFPARVAEIDAALTKAMGGGAIGSTPLAYVPMVGRSTFWTVLINANTAEVLAFVPIDSF